MVCDAICEQIFITKHIKHINFIVQATFFNLFLRTTMLTQHKNQKQSHVFIKKLSFKNKKRIYNSIKHKKLKFFTTLVDKNAIIDALNHVIDVF